MHSIACVICDLLEPVYSSLDLDWVLISVRNTTGMLIFDYEVSASTVNTSFLFLFSRLLLEFDTTGSCKLVTTIDIENHPMK